MDELVEADEIVDNQHVHLFLVHLDPQFINIYQILAQHDGFDSQLILISHLMLFYYQFPLEGSGLWLHLTLFGRVVD